MKISKISVFRVELPIVGKGFRHSGGRLARALDSTILRIDTDSGISGWGETCPFGSDYLPAFAEGARAALGLLAPALLGRDPRRQREVATAMESALLGHDYVKAALDIACWDILGRSLGLPLAELLGGWVTEDLPIMSGIPPSVGDDPAEALKPFRARGQKEIFVKASGDAEADIVLLRSFGDALEAGERIKVDANGGWRVEQAIRVVRALGSIDLVVEQPCNTLAECIAVKRATGCVLVLDECVCTARDLAEAHSANALDGLNLKIGRVGGLTRARLLRDLCLELNLPLYIQDVGGNDITKAAIAHLGHATPGSHLQSVWNPSGISETHTAEGAPEIVDGRMRAGSAPGLGIEPLADVLGEALAVYT